MHFGRCQNVYVFCSCQLLVASSLERVEMHGRQDKTRKRSKTPSDKDDDEQREGNFGPRAVRQKPACQPQPEAVVRPTAPEQACSPGPSPAAAGSTSLLAEPFEWGLDDKF